MEGHHHRRHAQNGKEIPQISVLDRSLNHRVLNDSLLIKIPQHRTRFLCTFIFDLDQEVPNPARVHPLDPVLQEVKDIGEDYFAVVRFVVNRTLWGVFVFQD